LGAGPADCPGAPATPAAPAQGPPGSAGPQRASPGCCYGLKAWSTVKLTQVEGSGWLEHKPGWNLDLEQGLVCPAGKILRVYKVVEQDPPQVVFRARRGDCGPCALRSDCTNSTRSNFQKEVGLPLRSLGSREPPVAAAGAVPPKGEPRGGSAPAWQLPQVPPPGPWQPCGPLLLPAVLRKQVPRQAHELEIRVEIHKPAPQRLAPYLVDNAARRRHQRLTWTERVRRNALSEQTQVTVQIERPPDSLLGKVLSGFHSSQKQAA
jgi:hypothetical protein